jgi:flagellar hook-basal body complex protein FliE
MFMNVGSIGTEQIQSMLSQLRTSAARPSMPQPLDSGAIQTGSLTASSPSTRVEFSTALKSALNQVNTYQSKSEELGKKFALGDNNVGLSDVMMAGQKASISLQSALQVRNKLVSAYQSIMNMQV